MPAPAEEEVAKFQPGQLGLRHLLGVLTAVALVLGVSASRWRTMTTVEAAQVGIHWITVLALTGVSYVIESRWRRSIRNNAGALWLRVLQKPVTETRRRRIRWLLTAAVIADGVFISLVFGPGKTITEAMETPWMITVLIQLPMMESWLWLACIRHWLDNPYWVDFREHGIFVHRYFAHTGLLPWAAIKSVHWSEVHRNSLVLHFQRNLIVLPIDPAYHNAVSDLLKKLPSASPLPVGAAAAGS